MATMMEYESGEKNLEEKYNHILENVEIWRDVFERNRSESAHKNLLYSYGKLCGAFAMLEAFYTGTRNDIRLGPLTEEFNELTKRTFGEGYDIF